MAFHSLTFLFGFLPLALGSYLVSRAFYKRATLFILLGLSLIFYAWASLHFLGVLVLIILLNYGCGFAIKKYHQNNQTVARIFLAIGIALNVVLLLSLKSISATGGLFTSIENSILPLGMSYLTFGQIAFLIEVFQQRIEHPSLLEYFTFVLLFPKVIAGPIVRPSELLLQMKRLVSQKIDTSWMQALGFLAIGLFKKAIIADQLALVVDPIFQAMGHGSVLSMYRAWYGIVAYGLQLYFDFSGYTDMAIGVALFFGIRLPINFNAPYRAMSIGDFWRRWHITLSNFFRDYVYIPLGGNRKGFSKELINVMAVMVLCGLWHGIGLTFIVWGAMHGCYLVLQRVWGKLHIQRTEQVPQISIFAQWFKQALTFMAVTVAWVPFRADSLRTALHYYSAMFSAPSLRIPTAIELLLIMFTIVVPLLIVWVLPTSQHWLAYEGTRSNIQPTASPSPAVTMPPISPEAIPITKSTSTQSLSSGEITAINRSWLWFVRLFFYAFFLGCISVAALSVVSQRTEFIYGGF